MITKKSLDIFYVSFLSTGCTEINTKKGTKEKNIFLVPEKFMEEKTVMCTKDTKKKNGTPGKNSYFFYFNLLKNTENGITGKYIFCTEKNIGPENLSVFIFFAPSNTCRYLNQMPLIFFVPVVPSTLCKLHITDSGQGHQHKIPCERFLIRAQQLDMVNFSN